MAVIDVARTPVGTRGHHHLWAPMEDDDTGEPVKFPMAADRAVHVFGGDFDSGVLTWEGSLELLSPTHWFALTDPQGNPISFTDDGGEQVMETIVWIRPVTAGGLGSMSVTALMFSGSTMR